MEKVNPKGPGLQVGFIVTGELKKPFAIDHDVEEA